MLEMFDIFLISWQRINFQLSDTTVWAKFFRRKIDDFGKGSSFFHRHFIANRLM